MIIIGFLQENSTRSSKSTKASLWSENMGLLSTKKNSSTLIKKSNSGIKINVRSSQNKTSTTESAISSDKETLSQLDKTPNTSTSNIVNIDTKSDNVGNGLSLLGAYLDSSDSD